MIMALDLFDLCSLFAIDRRIQQALRICLSVIMMTSFLFVLLSSNIPLCLTLVLLLVLIHRLLTGSSADVLAHVPGPPPLPILGNALLLYGPSEDVWLPTMKMLREKYGPVVRFSLGSMVGVCIAGPEEFEKILSSNVHITKGFVYSFVWPWMGQGLITSTGHQWKTRRKLLTPAFHFKILEHFLNTINDQAEILCSKLKTRVGDSLVNIYPFITHCSLDIICETAMGRKINCQSDGNSPFVKAVSECQNLVFHRMCSPWLWNDFIFSFTPCGKKLSKCLDTIHDFTQTVIKERKREISEKSEKNNNEALVDDIGRKQRLSFLDLLIETSKHGKDLTDEDIEEEVDTFMIAGHDTTASNISMTLYLLAHHPQAQSKCQEELDQIFLDSDRLPTSEDLNSMKYLHSCIKESLRLYGSVPAIERTTGEPNTPKCRIHDVTYPEKGGGCLFPGGLTHNPTLEGLGEPVEVGGYLLPANTDVYLNMAVLHRNPASFPDPQKFFPDRFLGSNEGGRHPYAYVPFSAGPRNCIGQKFAVMEEKAVISAVLRRFQLHTRVAIGEVALLPELVLKPRDGLFVQIRHRKIGTCA